MEGRKREVEREGRRGKREKDIIGSGEIDNSTCIPLVAKYRLWFIDKQADIPGHHHACS